MATLIKYSSQYRELWEADSLVFLWHSDEKFKENREYCDLLIQKPFG